MGGSKKIIMMPNPKKIVFFVLGIVVGFSITSGIKEVHKAQKDQERNERLKEAIETAEKINDTIQGFHSTFVPHQQKVDTILDVGKIDGKNYVSCIDGSVNHGIKWQKWDDFLADWRFRNMLVVSAEKAEQE